MGLDSCQQFRLVERFGDIIHTAGFQSLHDIERVVHCREEDDRDFFRIRSGFQLLADFKTSQAGHHDVQQNEVEGCLLHPLQCVLAAFGESYVIAGFF